METLFEYKSIEAGTQVNICVKCTYAELYVDAAVNNAISTKENTPAGDDLVKLFSVQSNKFPGILGTTTVIDIADDELIPITLSTELREHLTDNMANVDDDIILNKEFDVYVKRGSILCSIPTELEVATKSTSKNLLTSMLFALPLLFQK